VLLHSHWRDRPVIGMLDSLWGVLDGLNAQGLAVSLAFGGRRVVGDGFGMPLILRYILETCETAAEAEAVLLRVPSHMAYNVSVLDAGGDYRTVFVAPDRAPQTTRRRVATNHQGPVDWPAYATATGTLDREQVLVRRGDAPGEVPERFVDRFLEPPLYQTRFEQGWGTLYTAVYHPAERRAEFRWPGVRIEQCVEHFEELTLRIRFPEHEEAP
jgi:predicted choloylglycine hydrolase